MKIKKFGRLCECKDMDGTFFVFRRGKLKSRIFSFDSVNAEGEQVNSSDIINLTKIKDSNKTFVNTCNLQNREGIFWVIRKDKHHTLVAPDGFVKNDGEEVLTESLINIRDYGEPELKTPSSIE